MSFSRASSRPWSRRRAPSTRTNQKHFPETIPQEEAQPVRAKVLEVLPNARYRVQTANGEEVLAHVSGKMRMHLIRILPGDEVGIEVSPFDRNLARITQHGSVFDKRAKP